VFLHHLLQRQLKRVGLDASAAVPTPSAWRELLQRVSRAYEDHTQEVYLLERSQALASRETEALNHSLRLERDLLEQRVSERTAALRLSEARLGSLLSLSADWVWEQDAEMRFTFLSEGVRAAAGIDPASLLGLRRGADEGFDASDEEWAAYRHAVQARLPFRDFNYRYNKPGGTSGYFCISGVPTVGEDGSFQGYRGVGRDLTQGVLAERKLEELARLDGLTGLPNRNMLREELGRAIARSRRNGHDIAVCFADLDRFKTINDKLGHAAGDQLLQQMAARLRGSVRSTDMVVRMGGDEFVLLLEDCGTAGELAALTHKVLQAMGQPLSIQGCNFVVTGSLGVARFPADGDDVSTLLQHADAAMYLAKARGKNNVQFYTAELAQQAEKAFETESALRLGLTRNELILHYQPKLRVQTGELTGLEALVRWCHPSRGMVPPGEFIPLAEERGLIIPIGRWVLFEACRQVRAWRNAGLRVPQVAVNLSARQFADPGLIDDIQQALQANGLIGADLEVELTESVLMAEPELADAVLRRLHETGVHISIDDFGTGYSSLSYLKRFPAQTLKIDRSFIQGLPDDADDSAITQAVIAMAHSLGLQVVAEGVETEAQLSALQQMGCDQAQGFLLGRPQAAAELATRFLGQAG